MGCASSATVAKPTAPQCEPNTLLGNRRVRSATSCSLPESPVTPSPVLDALGSRGLGEFVRGVHHVALIVQDVGDSLFFYTDIVGFQQINRVSFDRHGAWLTMGNIQLHLIKGMPHTRTGQHPNDLIVSHVALDVTDIQSVLARLHKLKAEKYSSLRWRQNVSVPTHDAASTTRFESDHTSPDDKLTQFFLEDPDGYWLEFCNCGDDELKADMRRSSPLSAGISPPGDFWADPEISKEVGGLVDMPNCSRLNHPSKLKGCVGSVQIRLRWVVNMAIRTLRWSKRACGRLSSEKILRQELSQLKSIQLEAVDAEKLTYLGLRRNTYGDICQGFSNRELQQALAQAGNYVPGAVLVLKFKRRDDGQVYLPPSFLDDAGAVVYTTPFRMSTSGRVTTWV